MTNKAKADSSATLRNDKQESKQQQMRGFFAALRMTTEEATTGEATTEILSYAQNDEQKGQ